jgi:hypothetical protein
MGRSSFVSFRSISVKCFMTLTEVTAMLAPPLKKESSETIRPFVDKAIFMLIKNQISDTLILSSYKINTVIKNNFGKDFKVEVVGRCLARIAKQNQLRRISTRIPKYELGKSKFHAFRLPD